MDGTVWHIAVDGERCPPRSCLDGTPQVARCSCQYSPASCRSLGGWYLSGAPSAFGFVSGGVAGASFHVFPWFAKEAFFLEVLFEEFDRLVAANDGKVVVNGPLDFHGHLCKRIFFCHFCLDVSFNETILWWLVFFL